MGSSHHHWIVSDPLCEVRGSIRMTGQPDISFVGQGYHDHNYGTGPIGPGLKRWFWGRVLLEDRALTFHFARPKRRKMPDESHLIEADASGMREVSSDAEIDWSVRSRLWLAYPGRARFGEVLALSRPRLIDSSPFYMRLLYDADVRGRKGTALTEVAYPHRLRWPVLGRMIEMSILRER
jgi:carotenoid 1,2-hydratase